MTSVELLEAMGELDDELIEPKDKTASKVKWRRWVALAACVALVLTLGMAWYYGNTIELGSGDRLSLGYGGVLSKAQYDINGILGCEVDYRILTHEEVSVLLDGYPVSQYGQGYFDHETGNLVGFSASGSESNLSFYVSSASMWPTETCRVNGQTTVVDGVPITAGYAVWYGDSTQKVNIIYFAELEQQGQTVRIEMWGAFSEKYQLQKELAEVIDYLLQKGKIDLLQVKY